jgi:hypothetical protein
MQRRFTQAGTLGNRLRRCARETMLTELDDGRVANCMLYFVTSLFCFGARLKDESTRAPAA